MSRIPRLLALVGLAAFAFGVAALIEPTIAGSVAGGRWMVIAVGLFALTIGGYLLRKRYRTSPEEFDLPEPEQMESYPTPGDEAERSLAAVSPAASTYRRPDLKQELHQRLGMAAIDAQVIVEGRSEAEAKERLESGAWTDNPHAAALFLGELPDWAPRGLRLRALLAVGNRYDKRARHAIDEIDAIVEGTDGEG